MRVVHLSAYGGPYPGSFVPMLRAVNNAADNRGWSFEAVFTPEAASHPWYAELMDDGVTVQIAPAGSRRALSSWLGNFVAERRQGTVLHTHFTRFDLPAVMAARQRNDTVVIWHIHNRPGPGLSEATRNTLKFAVAGHLVDRILCVSKDTAEVVRRRCAPSQRVMVFPNAIDLQRFRLATVEERKKARAELGIPAGHPLLVHFGWDWDIKGGDLFLESVAILAGEGIDLTAMCVGGGEPARTASTRLGIEDRVLVVPARDDVRTLYAAADAFVSSSRVEGAMPFAALESLSVGTPVVASMIANHVLLAEHVRGCVLAERDPQSFAAALRFALNDRAEHQLTVDITDLAENLDLEVWAQRLLDLYAERLHIERASSLC